MRSILIETDDISTLLVGPPEVLFPAMRDLYAVAAKTGAHCVLSAVIWRGCPSEPDDEICASPRLGGSRAPLDQRKEEALEAVAKAPAPGTPAAAQFSLYVMDTGNHTDEIYGCIDFWKRSGVFDRSKNFCTRLGGNSGAVFALHALACLF